MAPRTTGCVKEIGHRQVYDILQSRKPRASGADLWVFRFSRRFEAHPTADWVCTVGPKRRRQARVPA